jgi:hypothetical protein
MPEHFHARIWPTAEANPSQIMPKLEDRPALLILFWNDASILAMDKML